MMSERVKLASIGLGRWARVPARGAQRGTVIEMASCFSRSPESRSAFQEEFGVPKAASSLDELLSDPEIEGVLVTTPNDAHKAVILEGLDAGKVAPMVERAGAPQ